MAILGKKSSHKDADEMTFLEHLNVLRGHLLRSIASVVVFAIIAFLLKDFIFSTILLAPKSDTFFTNRVMCQLGHLLHTSKICLNDKPLDIINIDLAGQFKIHLTISLFGGLILSSPYIFFELYRFIMPALKEKERKYSRGMVFYTTMLFLIGVLFGYYLITPLTINFLGGYSVSAQVANQINLRSYIGTITSLILSTGLVFELPVLIYFLSKVGIVTASLMKHYRKHALVVFLLLSGIITPPDLFSQFLVCIPLYLLFELSIMIAGRIDKQRQARDEAEETVTG